MLERDVENPSKAYARRQGDYVRKFSSPANRAVPDDLFITKTRYGHVTWFVEFKAPGRKLTLLQYHEHVEIQQQGGLVYTCDDKDDFKRIRNFIVQLGYGRLREIGEVRWNEE